jgi:hypothetical protein
MSSAKLRAIMASESLDMPGNARLAVSFNSNLRRDPERVCRGP